MRWGTFAPFSGSAVYMPTGPFTIGDEAGGYVPHWRSPEAGGVVAAELVQLAADVTPYVTAAAGAYGGAVLTKTKDEAAGATVELGRRLLQKIFGHREQGEEVPEPLADVIADPNDADNIAALRKAVRKALEADETLATDVWAMLSEVRVGDHSNVVTGSHVEGHVIQIGSVDGGLHINDDR